MPPSFSKRFFLSIAATTLAVAGCQTKLADPSLALSAKHFHGPVKNLLEHRCIHCHHDNQPNAGLNFQDRRTVFDKAGNGPFVVPGDPEASKVWKAVSLPKHHARFMPGDGWDLSQRHLQGVREWIEKGAYWPEGRQGKLRVKNYEVELDDYL